MVITGQSSRPDASALGLGPTELDGAFPFHFAFDAERIVRHVGHSLARLAPEIRPGVALDEVLEWRVASRAAPLPTFADLAARRGQLVLWRRRRDDLTLRGELVPAVAGSMVLFLGSPWLIDAEEMRHRGLGLNDFAVHDPMGDLLMVLQLHRVAAGDLQALAARLQERNDGLVRLEHERTVAVTRLSRLIESLPGAVLLENEGRQIVLVNQQFCDLFQVPAPPAALLGADCTGAAARAAPLFREENRFVERIDQILRERGVVLAEEWEFKDGRVFLRDYVPLWVEGDYFGHFWHYRDVTEQRRVAAALAAERELLRVTLASISDAVITTDLELRVTFLNAAAQELLRPPAAALRTCIAELVPLTIENGPPWRERLLQVLTPPAADPVPEEQEGVLRNGLGQDLPVAVRVRPLRGASQELLGAAVVLRDLRREQEAARLKRNFVATVSHELRTPLNAVLGLAELLQSQIHGPLDDRQRREVDGILHAGRHLLDLVNTLLEYARLSSQPANVTLEPVALEPLLREVADLLRLRADQQQVAVVLALAPGLPHLSLDPRALRQVVSNLLDNAIKFTPPGGSVTLGLSEVVEGRVAITVRDTGIGIAPEDQERIFAPFIQVENDLNRRYNGAGLGLAIVRELVERSGGRLSLRSGLGEGTCVCIELPATPAAPGGVVTSESVPRDAAPMPPPPGAAAPPLVLLAEDNALNREVMAALLERHACRLIFVEDGLEAIAAARRERPDLIFMDVQMPRLDGLQATQRLRADPATADLRIVALTAFALHGDEQRCLEAGADGYLSKPVDVRALANCLQRFLPPARLPSRQPG